MVREHIAADSCCFLSLLLSSLLRPEAGTGPVLEPLMASLFAGKYPGGCLCAAPGTAQADCDNQTAIMLDKAAEVGLKVMVDLAVPFRTIVCGSLSASSKACPASSSMDRGGDKGRDGDNLVGVADPAAAWADVKTAVDRYKLHPALLGYYVCDDCMTSWIVAQRAAGTPTVDTMYTRLKQIDPHHVVIGAIESVDMFVFESSNVFVPEASLDVPMLENYVGSVAMNAAMGPQFDQPGNDGSIRG